MVTFSTSVTLALPTSPFPSFQIQVTVFITDMNDNRPEFREINLPVRISEATSPFSTITTVSATDADSGGNAQINFYVSSQSDDGVFVINDPSTGIITLAEGQSLDRDQL